MAIIIPLALHPWWAVLAFYLAVSWSVGVLLAVVFQLAHCVEDAEFVTSNDHVRGRHFADHQLRTTLDVRCRIPSSIPSARLSTNSFALDPISGTSRALPLLIPDAGQRVAGWDGSAVYVATIADSQPSTVHRLEFNTTAWVSSEPSDLDGLNVDATTTVWTGNSFVFTSNTHDGAIYDIATETWTAIPPTLSSVRLPAVWTEAGVTVGDRLLDPAAGEWQDVAPPPEPYRWPASAVWTGTEYIVWGGDACAPGRTV